ncbi:GNAT family N-acetyltransferase [Bosea sp. (in: a-proteobacteria)]
MPTSGGINARFDQRGFFYCDDALATTLARIYGLTVQPLLLNDPAGPAHAYWIKRPGTSRVVLAPFNFQPVLAPKNEEIVRQIIGLAERGQAGTTARIKLHHPLADTLIGEFGLSCVLDGIETLVSLEGGTEGVVRRMRPRHRTKLRAVREACSAAGLTVQPFSDERSLEIFYRILVEAYRDKHAMLPQPFSLFRALLRHNTGVRRSIGYAAINQISGEMAGGIIVLQDEQQWCYAWGANRASSANLEVGTYLIGHALDEAIAAGARIFSLGMSAASQDDLRRYKRGWGGEEHEVLSYGWREHVRTIDLHRDFALARKMLRLTPKSLIKAISPLVVRWLV